MTSARVTTLVLGSALLTTWFVSAAVTRRGEPAPPAQTASPAAAATTAPEELQVQADRLHARLDAAPAPRRSARNPFRFAPAIERPPAAVEPQLAARPDAAPETAPPSPPSPTLRLVGIAAGEGGNAADRTAALSLGGMLLLVRPGDDVAGRYRVAAISADVVELTDRLGGPTLRLALR